MNVLVPIMMFGWIPVVMGLFSKLPARRAVIAAFLFAWLFLPIATYPIPGFPDYTKMSATCWGILIVAALFDTERLLIIKLRVIDIPMIIWCISPLGSSLSNDLGLYDGVASALTQTVTWGFPYFIGRVYFSDLDGLREFAIGIFIGGLIYMPFCWYEIRMSPKLHHMVYGFTQHSFAQSFRFGGWRPMVFLQHGLAVGVWMMGASLIGLCLWVSGTLKKLWSIPMRWLVLSLIFTSIMCRSTGAIALFLMGIGVLFVTKKLKRNVMIICLLLIPVLYIPARATGYWDGDNLAHFLYDHFNRQRALSLYGRFYFENMLVEKALEKPTFGWGGWGGARVYDEYGTDISVTDGLWIIAFGSYGLVGLTALTMSILMPIIMLMRRYHVKDWFHPKLISATALSVLLGLYMIDSLLNAMVNPIFMVAAGGITGLTKESFEVCENFMEPTDVPWMSPVYKPRFL